LLASQVDQELSELGAVPADVRAIAMRVLGRADDTTLSLADADELLASLSASLGDNVGTLMTSTATTEPRAASSASPATVETTPAWATRNAPEIPVPGEPPARDQVPAAPQAVAIPAPATPQLTAAERRRAEFAAAMIDSTPAGPISEPAARAASDAGDVLASDPQAFEADTDLSEPPPRGPSGAPPAERRLEGEATAQAIVAAFDDPEFDAEVSRRRSREDERRVTLDSPLPAAMERPDPSALEFSKRLRRRSPRPDLDKLLDQPLDALDFERSEPVADPAKSRAPSSAPPAAAQPASANDDFEILVDDEILEIAEDEVELVDEEPSR